jgi:competence protein ComEC
MILGILCGMVIFVYYLLLGKYLQITFIPSFINHIFNCDIRAKLIEHIDNTYKKDTAALIEAIAFAYRKSEAGSDIYKKMSNLNTVYLLSVSGMHLFFIKIIISKIIKNEKVSSFTTIIIILIYTYFLNFAVGCLRVLFTLIISRVTRKYKTSSITSTSLSAMVTILICPSSILNYGFTMSYMCTICARLVHKQFESDCFIDVLLTNLICITSCIPFEILMSSEINVLSLFLSALFNFLFMPLYVFTLLTF